MKNLLLVPLLLCFIFSAEAEIDFINNDMKKAIRLAEEENKLIFIDIYTDWCSPCKIMEKHVFSDNEVSNYFNLTFINLKINAEKGIGKQINEKIQDTRVSHITIYQC